MKRNNRNADSLARAARPVIEALESRTLLSGSPLPNVADSALAYDANGKLHLAYQDAATQSLKYATRLANGRWVDGGTIDDSSPNVGAMVSLALASDGSPAAAYYDAQNGDLKYAHWNGTTWDTQTVDTHGATGLYPSLAFDSADAPIIASYSATRGDLRLSKLYHGGWRSFTLDAEGDVGRHPALAVDPTSGLWTVAYEATGAGELRFVNAFNGGRVLGGVIDAKALGGSVSLAFEGATSRARVGYADALSGEVRVATGTAAGWTSDVVGKGTEAVAVRPDGGTAGLVYRDDSGTLRLVERPAVQKAKWSSVEIGTGTAGSAAAFSAAGDVAVTQPGANPASATAPAVGERFAAAPSWVTVTHIDASTLRVDWLDNTVGESGFLIESSADSGKTWQEAAVTGRNATATNVGGLTEGKTYLFRASATGGAAAVNTASARAAAAPAASGTDPLDTPGWFRIKSIASASGGERKYQLEDHVVADTQSWFYASSWATAAYQATNGYEHVIDTNKDYYTFDDRAFRFGYSAAIKRETEGPATQLPDDEKRKIIAFEDSYGAIDRDFDDKFWDVDVEKLSVTKVEFVQINSALSSNTHPNGSVGSRIFPDKQSPSDQVARNQVKIRVTLSQPVPNIPIHYNFFDVDDPSTDAAPVDPNGVKGSDNRGSFELDKQGGMTNQTGISEAILITSKRPGDNERIGVALTEEAFAGLTNDNVPVDNTQITSFEGRLTDLLTIWRKLYVEVDSMQPGTISQNRETGTIHGATFVPSTTPGAQSYTRLSIDDLGDDFGEFDHFSGGLLKLPGFAVPLYVLGSESYSGKDVVYVSGDYATGANNVTGASYELYDDDMELDAQGNIGFKATLGYSDTSKLKEALSYAYMEPEFITNTSDALIAFDRNLNEGSFSSEQYRVMEEDRQYPVTMVNDDFIAVHLVTAFQGRHDHDVDGEGSGNLGISAPERMASLIYREVTREFVLAGSAHEYVVVVHEIGHLLGGEHSDLGAMTDGEGKNYKYSPITLATIRSKTFGS